MAKGEIFGSLPPMAKGIIAVAVVGSIGFVGYKIYKHIESKRLAQAGKQLAGNVDLTSGGLADVAKRIPPSKLAEAKASLKSFDVKQIADLIYNSHGVFNDEEEDVYAAFSMLKNQAQLALLADYFERLYKKGLFFYLQSFLDASELKKINDITKTLPVY